MLEAQSEVLLIPLEMIVASDDAVVRDKAIEALKKVTERLTHQAINSKYMDLCRRLKKGDVFSMRIAAC